MRASTLFALALTSTVYTTALAVPVSNEDANVAGLSVSPPKLYSRYVYDHIRRLYTAPDPIDESYESGALAAESSAHLYRRVYQSGQGTPQLPGGYGQSPSSQSRQQTFSSLPPASPGGRNTGQSSRSQNGAKSSMRGVQSPMSPSGRSQQSPYSPAPPSIPGMSSIYESPSRGPLSPLPLPVGGFPSPNGSQRPPGSAASQVGVQSPRQGSSRSSDGYGTPPVSQQSSRNNGYNGYNGYQPPSISYGPGVAPPGAYGRAGEPGPVGRPGDQHLVVPAPHYPPGEPPQVIPAQPRRNSPDMLFNPTRPRNIKPPTGGSSSRRT